MGGLLAATQRDAWDWLLYALALAAAVVALIGFGYWTLSQRRRPEAEIRWSFSPKPETASLAEWSGNYVPELRSGATALIEVAIRNLGDRAPDNLLWSFVGPGSVQLKRRGRNEKPLTAPDSREALGPSPDVVFFAGGGSWPPGTWIALFFEVTYTADPGMPDAPARFVFKVADNRFNGNGRRWLPAVLPPDDLEDEPVGSQWPPTTRHPRRFGRITVVPAERVACRQGVRRDVREAVLRP